MHLRDAGERRANANRHTPDGMKALHAAYADIRYWTAEARRLRTPEGRHLITVRRVAATVGISPSGLDNIINNRVGAVPSSTSSEAVDVAQQLRTLAEWIRDPSDDTRPPAETAEALDAAVRLLVTQ